MARVVFMGTPEFAVPILSELVHAHEVVAVYTRADKPAGRGKQVAESPVKVLARAKGLTVEQPPTLRSEQMQARLRAYYPAAIVVAAYGMILPQAVLDIPTRGSINVHASLLPRWRGAAPIAAAILAGDSETGVTLMHIDAGLDTGPIIAWQPIPIQVDDTTGTLTKKLSRLGAEILVRTLPAWLSGEIMPTPQNEAEATFSKLVKKEDGLIDWTRPAVEIARAVRAYDPWPSAYTYWDRVHLKILRAEAMNSVAASAPGTVTQLDKGVAVQTGAGMLLLRRVKLAGKRALSIEEFVRGQRGFIGSRLG